MTENYDAYFLELRKVVDMVWTEQGTRPGREDIHEFPTCDQTFNTTQDKYFNELEQELDRLRKFSQLFRKNQGIRVL